MSEQASASSSSNDEPEQLSAIEESLASFGMSDLDSEQGVILKDWSAQDFASIYIRFRPHLISHARKFLREETQAEEVVQDAFLYLMTALPELDSELGVLRFLKWKTKMLCLDMIRSSQSGLNNNLVPLPDEVADQTQPLDSLERADDAAIIRLALAKLSPRHREALIATLYEEKSYEEAAHQMGVGENAFRQLLFRARASFRQALVGEAEIEGKSAAEILSLAARKAASPRNTAIVALIAMSSLAISPFLENNTQPAELVTARIAEPAISNQPFPGLSGSAPDVTDGVPTDKARAQEVVAADTGNLEFTESLVDGTSNLSSYLEGEPGSSESNPEEDNMSASRDALNEALGENLVIELASQDLKVSQSNGQVTADNQAGLRANFAVDLNSQKVVQFLVIEFESDGNTWKAVPGNSLSVVEVMDGETIVSYAATDFLVGDFSGAFDFVSSADSVFSRSGVKLDLVIDSRGTIVSSEVTFLPKT